MSSIVLQRLYGLSCCVVLSDDVKPCLSDSHDRCRVRVLGLGLKVLGLGRESGF